MIYFIGNEHGAIKIGYTNGGVEKRLQALQAANADQLTVLGYEDGVKMGEGNLQFRFAHCKIRGEWFAAVDELLDYILSLSAVDERGVKNWIAMTLPGGNTADLQWLVGQVRKDVEGVGIKIKCDSCGKLRHGVSTFPLYGEVRVCGECRGQLG